MLLHVEQGARGRVFDLDTSREVPKIISLDFSQCAPTVLTHGSGASKTVYDGLGIVEAYRVGPDGREQGEETPDGWRWHTYRARGRFRWVPAEAPKPVAKLIMGAPKCAKCGSELTLRGDDLCPPCRAVDRGQRHKMRAERVDDPFAAHKCEQCSRQATWTVSDEVETTPLVTGVKELVVRGRTVLVTARSSRRRFAWDRAAVVDRRYYCDRHFQPPRLLDAKGEVMQQLDDEARPE